MSLFEELTSQSDYLSIEKPLQHLHELFGLLRVHPVAGPLYVLEACGGERLTDLCKIRSDIINHTRNMFYKGHLIRATL